MNLKQTMKKIKKKQPKTPLQETVFTLKKKWKTIKNKQKHWKIHLYLTLVLPVVLIIAIIKALKTYIRLKIRDIAVKTPSDLKQEKNKKTEKSENLAL